MSSNGSRSIRWWEKYGIYFDKVILSCHEEYIDIAHIINVADFLYSKDVIVTALLLMNPNKWDQCMNIITELKKSKYQWGIDLQEILVPNDDLDYSSEQKNILNRYSADI